MYQDIFNSLVPSIFRRILIFLFIKFFSKSHWTELFFLGTLGSFSLFVFHEVEVIATEYKTTTGVRAPTVHLSQTSFSLFLDADK